MKNSTLVLLCFFTLLTACDRSDNTTSTQESGTQDPGLQETSVHEEKTSLVSDTASMVQSATEKAGEELDTAIESAKVAADSLTESAKESAGDAMDAAVELKDSAVAGANNAVDSVKDVSSAAAGKSSEIIASVTGDDAKKGESIYSNFCVACHGAGVAGAPKLGDKTAWVARIAQGDAVLTQHAIEGYKGSTGYMPPKGGYMSLGYEDVSLAVQFMVSQAK